MEGGRGLSITLRIVLLLGVCLYLFLVFGLLKKKVLELKYSLIWISSGIVMLICVLSPDIIFILTKLLGIEMPVNAIFLLGHIFEVLILMMLSLIASKNKRRIKDLIQQNGLLEKRVRDLEESRTEKDRREYGQE